MKQILTALLAVMTLLANSQTVTLKTVTIHPWLELQNYEHYKRLVLSSPDSDVEIIEGFDFHWGYQYKIRVTATRLQHTLSDGTKYRFAFRELISKTKLPDSTRFLLHLDAKRYYHEPDSGEVAMNRTLVPLSDSTFLYFDEVVIEVPCQFREQFESIVGGTTTGRGTFVFIDRKRIRLVGL